jgi:hypothetical protein
MRHAETPLGLWRWMDQTTATSLQLKTKTKLLKKRSPKGKAVIISRRSDETQYTDIVRKARSRIALAEFEVKVTQTRFTKKDDLILELQAASVDYSPPDTRS